MLYFDEEVCNVEWSVVNIVLSCGTKIIFGSDTINLKHDAIPPVICNFAALPSKQRLICHFILYIRYSCRIASNKKQNETD